MPRKRVMSKRQTRNTLQAKAQAAWLFFWIGCDSLERYFADYEEAKAAWQLVKADYMTWHPPARWPWGPAGYWMFECPEAPFNPAPIPGLSATDSLAVQKRQALIRWGLIPADTPDPMRERARDTALFRERYGPEGVPGGPPKTPAEREEEWAAWLAERAAWVQLGYLDPA